MMKNVNVNREFLDDGERKVMIILMVKMLVMMMRIMVMMMT